MEAKPEFFRVFMPHVNSTRMRVCDAFLATLKDDDWIPKRVALRNSLKKAFFVEVSVENSGVYFDAGWTEFVAENGLEMGFILVFRFDGHSGFDVKIFDHSCCEKYMCEDDIDEDEGIEVEDGSNNVVVDDNGEENEDEDEDYGVDEDEDEDVEEDEDEDKDEEDEDDGVIGSDSDDCPADLSNGTYANPTNTKNTINYHRKRDTHGPRKPSGHVIAKHPQELRDNVLLHPKNPIFVADMKKQNVSPSYPSRFLYVPMSFANKHLKKFTAPGTLLDPKKITWPIKVRYTKSNKHWTLGYGWTAFVKGNKLQVGDTCVFELIEPEPLQLKVSIFRAVTR